jgi:rhodanese-related sulfurtransferase
MEYDAKTIWTFILVIAAAVAFRYVPRWRAKSPFVSAVELKKRLDAAEDVVILDVRTRSEFRARGGHMPSAINVPLGDLRARLSARDQDLAPLRNHPVYVHCRDELRAARAARALRDAGFSDVSVVKGGFRRWRRYGFEIEKEAS